MNKTAAGTRGDSPATGEDDRQRILVVEDSFDSAEMLRLVLSRRGHDVKLAHSGTEALAAFERFTPGVVICDIGLPGELDGHRIGQRLRTSPGGSRLLLIALSGYNEEEDVQNSREAGFDVHLSKPVDTDELQRVLEHMAALRKAGAR